jgi:hypothetical protein
MPKRTYVAAEIIYSRRIEIDFFQARHEKGFNSYSSRMCAVQREHVYVVSPNADSPESGFMVMNDDICAFQPLDEADVICRSNNLNDGRIFSRVTTCCCLVSSRGH